MKKVVVVIGGSKGIGRATAEYFYNQGWQVFVTARRVNTLIELAEKHPGIGYLPGDMLDEDVMNDVFSTVLAEYGRLDAVVVSAAKFESRPIIDIPSGGWKEVGRWVEAIGSVNQKAAQLMTKQAEGGVIVNIASLGGLREMVLADSSEYAAVKNAMVGIVASMNQESEKVHGVVICPGSVNTEMGHDALTKRNVKDKVEMLEPVEVAQATFGLIEDANNETPFVYKIVKDMGQVKLDPA